MEFRNLDQHPAFSQLKARVKLPDMRTLLDARRVEEYACSMGHEMSFNYAATPMTDATLELLQELAQQAGVLEQYRAVLDGAIMNASENRMVLHHLTRGQCGAPVAHQGADLGEFYRHERERISTFSQRVHSGEVRSSAGHAFKYLCQIGIGGSDLGPRALYLALEQEARRCKEQKMEAEFISNVDPDDAARVLGRLDLARTLFILVSKSGTTQETLTNATLVREALKEAGLSPAQHMVVVTAQGSPLAQDTQLLERFYIDDFVGGRFSSTSAVGGVLLTLCFGAQVFTQLLEGAHQQDKLALQESIRANPALLDALIGVYLRNCLGYSATAVLPYSQGLQRFPAHLQQLDMESNGKQVNRSGQTLDYATGPVIFGEPGTNGQHSFYQLLHQGTEIIPVQFVGFACSQSDADRVIDGSTSQQKLNANLAAQIVAFAKGKDDADLNNSFNGERPSCLIHAPRLTPHCLGALLAHYENKVMFQGFLWNLNSFDQPGVQLGKLLTGQVLRGAPEDGALRAYASRLGIDSAS
ncbi:MAG: glucose-6-phosphate isomerase [Desulfuromonadaceae bacterium]|nr:glucose-6-phosphate isomerase [Desulfuromonas sp.]MDY0184526.1 glucose-6-phosphate isomerase [Desulfuromonadaceae bacterium]